MNFTYQTLTIFLCFNLPVYNEHQTINWCIMFTLTDLYYASKVIF